MSDILNIVGDLFFSTNADRTANLVALDQADDEVDTWYPSSKPRRSSPLTPRAGSRGLSAGPPRWRLARVEKLVHGIHAFQESYFATNRDLFERLATDGQRPETLFITCSDSRLVPNLITSTAPGELFIVRNVGNIVPSYERGLMGGVAAAIEFAVQVLEVQNIIVCGHTGCGAMEVLLHPERAEHLPFVRRWLAESGHLPALIAERYAHLDERARLVATAEENVLAQLENLRTFDFVSARLGAGKLKLSGWLYAIATGQVFDYDPASEQFRLLAAEEAE